MNGATSIGEIASTAHRFPFTETKAISVRALHARTDEKRSRCQSYTGQIAVQPPSQADAGHVIFLALQQWVEKGVAPQRVVAAKYASDSASNGVQMTRPLCVYPNVARYSCSGDPNSESSFICTPADGKTGPAQVPAPEYLN